jgi:hypothetical protein
MKIEDNIQMDLHRYREIVATSFDGLVRSLISHFRQNKDP